MTFRWLAHHFQILKSYIVKSSLYIKNACEVSLHVIKKNYNVECSEC